MVGSTDTNDGDALGYVRMMLRRPSAVLAPAAFVASFAGLAGALLSQGGCKRQELEETPDAEVRCPAGAYIFCEAGAPADQGCAVPAQDPRLAPIAPGAYPLGCVVNFVSAGRDVGGDCRVDGICRCNPAEDGGIPTPHWSCFP